MCDAVACSSNKGDLIVTACKGVPSCGKALLSLGAQVGGWNAPMGACMCGQVSEPQGACVWGQVSEPRISCGGTADERCRFWEPNLGAQVSECPPLPI